jgi:hypothetical protein
MLILVVQTTHEIPLEGIVTTRTPPVDFKHLTWFEIGAMGLAASRRNFDGDVEDGLTNGDSMVVRLGYMDDDRYVELSSGVFGPDGEGFRDNIDQRNGKLATSIWFDLDSIDAVHEYPDRIPEGPRGYTGAVTLLARAHTRYNGWMKQRFTGAGSGVQGHFDAATVSAGLRRMAACWAQQQYAEFGEYGKP